MKQILLLSLIYLSTFIHAQTPGNALHFDGTDDRVVVNSLPALFSNLATNDFTFEAWVNPYGSAFQRIIFAQFDASNFATMSIATGNVIYFYVVVNGTTYSVVSTSSILQNQWSHVACRWISSTQTPEIFFNGIIQPTGSGGSSSVGTNGLLTIGSRPDGFQYFNGELDEVRIWSEARSACAISSNFNSTFTTPTTNLVASYNFDQGSASGVNTGVVSLNDLTTNHIGTLINFALNGTTSNWINSSAIINSIGSNGSVPAAPTGASTQEFCQNATVNDLTAVGSSIQWYDSGVGGTVLAGTTAVTNGVTYYASQSINGCESTTLLPVTVTVLQPSAPTGDANQSFCNSASVDDLIAVGSSIQWYDSGVGGTVLAGTIAVTDGATYYASQSINGCESTTLLPVTVSVFQPAAPTGDANQSFCNSATADDLIAVGSSIQWYDNASGGTLVSGTDALVDGGTYYASQTITNCESISLLPVTVTINTVSDISTSLSGISITSTNAFATYQWIDCANNFMPITGETNQSLTPNSNGSYAVQLTENGCIDTSDCVSILGVGLTENALNANMMIYPNPATTSFSVKTDEKIEDIRIYDMLGKEWMQIIPENEAMDINITALPAGMYSVNVTSESGNFTDRLIKN